VRKLGFFITLIFLFFIPDLFASRARVLDDKEMLLLKEYKESRLSNTRKFEDSELFTYIHTNLQNRLPMKKIACSLIMIQKLKQEHQKAFESTLLDLAKYLIVHGELGKHLEGFYPERVHQDYNPRGVLNQTLHAIAYLRTEKSYSFLLQLIYPVEQWLNPTWGEMVNAYEECVEQEKVYIDVRRLALGAIFQPLDKFGEKKVPAIEAIIQSFPNSDAAKIKMLENMKMWRKIYAGQTDAPYKP
jgi:hypothetical protein